MPKALLTLALALLLAACGGGGGGGNGGTLTGFTLALNPTELTLPQDRTGTLTLTVDPDDAFTGEATLSLSLQSPPTGVTLSPTSVTVRGNAPQTFTLTLDTSPETPVTPGTPYTLTLQAQAGSVSRTATLRLTAVSFLVDRTADEGDTTANDGVCRDGSAGSCTLRAALAEAGQGGRTLPVLILVQAGTYNLGSVLVLGGTAPTTLRGEGADRTFLDGGGRVRVLQVASGANGRLEGLTLQNGRADNGGGLLNSGTLTLVNSTVSGNSATAYYGGGLYNDGTLTLENSTVRDNRAGYGGGLYNNRSGTSVGTLTLQNSTVSENRATSGGGALNSYNATLTLQNSTVSRNSATDQGGGLLNVGTLTLQNSTVSGNQALYGGGLYNLGTLTLQNATVSGNGATSGGGGLYTNTDPGVQVALVFSTLTANTASQGGGVFVYRGQPQLKATILGGNTASSSGPDCFTDTESLNSAGYNLFGSTADCFVTLQRSDRRGDPNLGPLQDNGGPTKTHLPDSSSPTINAILLGGCTDLSGDPVTQDQRGVSRPQPSDGNCDIGSVEVE